MRSIEELTQIANNRIAANIIEGVDTPEKVAAYIQGVIHQEARMYLNSTDWYVIRKMERNIDVPVDIQANRLIAIAALNEE